MAIQQYICNSQVSLGQVTSLPVFWFLLFNSMFIIYLNNNTMHRYADIPCANALVLLVKEEIVLQGMTDELNLDETTQWKWMWKKLR